MSQQALLSLSLQQRAAVLGMVLALHLAVGWLLLGRMQQAVPSTLDMPPVNVALLKAAASVATAVKPPITRPANTSSRPVPPSPSPQATSAPTSAPSLAPVTPSASNAAPAPPSAVAASTSIATGHSDTAAALVSGSCAKPEYPLASRRMEEEGSVTLRFRVEANGQVSQSEVQNSSGFKRLDEAARAALSRCRFSPALAQGQATASWATLRYTWKLE